MKFKERLEKYDHIYQYWLDRADEIEKSAVSIFTGGYGIGKSTICALEAINVADDFLQNISNKNIKKAYVILDTESAPAFTGWLDNQLEENKKRIELIEIRGILDIEREMYLGRNIIYASIRIPSHRLTSQDIALNIALTAEELYNIQTRIINTAGESPKISIQLDCQSKSISSLLKKLRFDYKIFGDATWIVKPFLIENTETFDIEWAYPSTSAYFKINQEIIQEAESINKLKVPMQFLEYFDRDWEISMRSLVGVDLRIY